MRNLIIIFVFALFGSSCTTGYDCCVAPPALSEFHGEWKLVKIVNGFAQIEIEGDEIGFEESLVIDAAAQTFVRKREGMQEETSRLAVRKEGGQDALVLLDEDMYHWYHFEELGGVYHLVLYQKSYVDSYLADGSSYYYLHQ
ncbi:hypothetical protein [uncultured Arcticibacterium sp.]|uniref:hypothetical protein n=1 Tax=uncultured Arcticibacterium sp. TaxID=2173042 RepID=UPI0030F8A0AA